MNQDMNGERDLEKLLAEIRQMGEPYADPKPSEVYFANSRVRIMERIEREQSRKAVAVFGRFKEWLIAKPLRPVAIGIFMSACAVLLTVSGVFENHTVVERRVAYTMQPQAQAPLAQTAPSVEKAAAPMQKPDAMHDAIVRGERYAAQLPKRSEKTTHYAESNSNRTASTSTDLGDPQLNTIDREVAQPILSGSDVPVSLNDLSQQELEHVLHEMEHN